MSGRLRLSARLAERHFCWEFFCVLEGGNVADQTVNFNGRSFAGVVNEVKDELKEFLQTRIIMLKAELGEKMRTLKTALPMLITAAIFLGTAFLMLTLCLVGLVSVAFYGDP